MPARSRPTGAPSTLKDMRDNYGFGLRFGSSNAVALRADLAFGGEDSVRFIFGFASSF